MIDFQLAELIHRQIIINLTIRTLERDRKHIEGLKINRALELWMEQQIKVLQNDLVNVKSQLGKKGVKIQAEKKVDKEFTEYEIIVKGMLENRKYSNVALRNWVEEEVKRLFGLEYRITEDGMKPPGK